MKKTTSITVYTFHYIKRLKNICNILIFIIIIFQILKISIQNQCNKEFIILKNYQKQIMIRRERLKIEWCRFLEILEEGSFLIIRIDS